jgi:hypothetical protein
MALRKACEAGWGCREMRAGLKVLIVRVMLPEGLLVSGVRCPVVGAGVGGRRRRLPKTAQKRVSCVDCAEGVGEGMPVRMWHATRVTVCEEGLGGWLGLQGE